MCQKYCLLTGASFQELPQGAGAQQGHDAWLHVHISLGGWCHALGEKYCHFQGCVSVDIGSVCAQLSSVESLLSPVVA